MRRAAIVAATALCFHHRSGRRNSAARRRPTPAAAAGTGFGIGSNYNFPDGLAGFDLQATNTQNTDLAADGILNPEILVGFNPQPDPPGAPQTFLSLTDPVDPAFTNVASGKYDFVISFLNLLPAGCDPTRFGAPAAGLTGLNCSGAVGGADVTVDVALTFEGPLEALSWGAFNPQPDPPGDVAGFQMTFNADPGVVVEISVDGQTLHFTVVPEPGTLSLFGTALAGLAAWRRRHRRA